MIIYLIDARQFRDSVHDRVAVASGGDAPGERYGAFATGNRHVVANLREAGIIFKCLMDDGIHG